MRWIKRMEIACIGANWPITPLRLLTMDGLSAIANDIISEPARSRARPTTTMARARFPSSVPRFSNSSSTTQAVSGTSSVPNMMKNWIPLVGKSTLGRMPPSCEENPIRKGM